MSIKENPPVNITSQMGAETVGGPHGHTLIHTIWEVYSAACLDLMKLLNHFWTKTELFFL